MACEERRHPRARCDRPAPRLVPEGLLLQALYLFMCSSKTRMICCWQTRALHGPSQAALPLCPRTQTGPSCSSRLGTSVSSVSSAAKRQSLPLYTRGLSDRPFANTTMAGMRSTASFLFSCAIAEASADLDILSSPKPSFPANSSERALYAEVVLDLSVTSTTAGVDV